MLVHLRGTILGAQLFEENRRQLNPRKKLTGHSILRILSAYRPSAEMSSRKGRKGAHP